MRLADRMAQMRRIGAWLLVLDQALTTMLNDVDTTSRRSRLDAGA
jgi:hypothetical protein